MGWIKFEKKELAAILSFLIKNEYACLTVTDRIRKWEEDKEWIFPIKGFLYRESTLEITGALFFTKEGVAVPLLLAGKELESLEKQDDLLPFLNGASTFMGLTEDLNILKNLKPERDYKKVDFYLMTCSLITPPLFSLPEGYTFVRATVEDAERLFFLQRDYEIEEVALDPSNINPRTTFENLKRTLSRELVYYVEHHGKPVAKANTNAQGYLYDQIGGVFTLPEYRRRGISKYLVSKLEENVFKNNRKISLFVKINNYPAIRVYESSGFTIRGSFAISYYR